MENLLKELKRVENELTTKKQAIIEKEKYNFHDILQYNRLLRTIGKIIELKVNIGSNIDILE